MPKSNKIPLSKRFMENLLADYNMTIEQLNEEGWMYCGGDGGMDGKESSHRKWYIMMFGIEPIMEHVSNCVCGHHIYENCYICSKDKKELITLGNCCIKRFIDNCGRQCSRCETPHQNSKSTLCKDCVKADKIVEKIKKMKKCEKCNERHRNRKDNLCNNCREYCSVGDVPCDDTGYNICPLVVWD